MSIVIPARDEGERIGSTVRTVRAQASTEVNLEILVVDDGSRDATAERAAAAGATVLSLGGPGASQGPAFARNRGASFSKGDPIVFLDADCEPGADWLASLLRAHDLGSTLVGGSLDLPPGLPFLARCDYYCGWYLVHSRRPAGVVPHHPPPNLSVRREAFLATAGFSTTARFSYTNEERSWQAELRQAGHRIYFEPRARVFHYNRPGFGNLLRRNYRWGYTALEAKAGSGSARLAWLYRYPRLLIVASLPLVVAHTFYILGCWLRAGVLEPLWMLPWVLVSRLAYATGMTVGGVRWLRRGDADEGSERPRWG